MYKQLVFPVGLVLVTMANGRDYLFRVPLHGADEGCHPGARVLCQTRNGEQPGVISGYTAVPDSESLDFILRAAGVTRLEPLTAVLKPVPFDDSATYYRGKGVRDLPVTTTNARPGDPYITVHLPNGTVCVN